MPEGSHTVGARGTTGDHDNLSPCQRTNVGTTGNEQSAAFDYNANGRIDFADVVWLFNHL
ncbi:MAG: hypothetical protein ABFC38_10615 [Methanospirillum sp.]